MVDIKNRLERIFIIQEILRVPILPHLCVPHPLINLDFPQVQFVCYTDGFLSRRLTLTQVI